MLFYGFLKKHSPITELNVAIYVLANTCLWFLIGAVAAWIAGKFGGVSMTEIRTNVVSFGSLLALTVGYIGSVLTLMHRAE